MALDNAGSADHATAGMIANTATTDDVFAPRATFSFECVGPDGEVKWTDSFQNLVTTAGKNFILDTMLKGSAYTAAWYLVLKGTGTAAVGDTLASHAGWTEVTPYSGNRPSITWGTTTGGSNTSSAVTVSINATATVAGAGICTANTGTSGTAYNFGDFSAARSVASGDSLNVTMSLSIS